MRIIATAAILVVLAACSSGPGYNEAGIRPEPKMQLALAGIAPLIQSIPAERNGIRADDTGAIMFICADTPKHADKEVFINACPCGAKKYFHWDPEHQGFRCFACNKPFPNEKVQCPDCGRTPKRVRTRHSPKA